MNIFKSAFLAVALISTAACSSIPVCQNHPVICDVVTAVAVGSVAATIAANANHHSGSAPGHANGLPLNCTNNPASCQ